MSIKTTNKKGSVAILKIVFATFISISLTSCNNDDPSSEISCLVHQDCQRGMICSDGFCIDDNAGDLAIPDNIIMDDCADNLEMLKDDGIIPDDDSLYEASDKNEIDIDVENDEEISDADDIIRKLTITEKPSNPVTDETYTFKFSFTTGNDEGLKFECKLMIVEDFDNECKENYGNLRIADCMTRAIESERCDGIWYDCEKIKLYYRLPDGTYRFTVRAKLPYSFLKNVQYTNEEEYVFQIDRKLPCYVVDGSRDGHSRYSTPPSDSSGQFTAGLVKIISFQDTRHLRDSGFIDLDWIRIYAEIPDGSGTRICLVDGELIQKPNPNCYNGDLRAYTNNTGTCWGGWYNRWFSTNEHQIFTEMPPRYEDIISYSLGSYPDKVLMVWGTQIYLPSSVHYTRVWAAAKVKITGDAPTSVALDYYRELKAEWNEENDDGVNNIGNIEEGMLSPWAYDSSEWQILYNEKSIPAGWKPKDTDNTYCGFPLHP